MTIAFIQHHSRGPVFAPQRSVAGPATARN